MNNIELNDDRILVSIIEEETSSIIMMPNKSKFSKGIIALTSNVLVNPLIKGHCVVFKKTQGTDLTIDSKKYRILLSDQVIMTLEDVNTKIC